MDLKEEIEAAHGVAIAQTAIMCALIGVLRQQGVLSRDLLNVVFDAAATQIETAPMIDPVLAMRARQTLEVISSEMAKGDQADVGS